MQKNNVNYLVKTAMIAAAYAALTIAFSFLSYPQVQFRISEILVLFAFFEPKYFTGLVLGCILANLPSPLGVVDVVAGSSATAIAVLFIIFIRNSIGNNKKGLIIASFGPVIANAIIVGIELTVLFETPFLINAFYVALGEFVVVTIAGTIVMSKLSQNSAFLEKIKL